MMTDKILDAVLNEKDVENFYRQFLTKKFGDMIFSSPCQCDGYGESKKHNIKLLCEFKDNLDLSLRINQVKVLSQVIYYLKKFEVSGEIFPSVVFIGDRDECFTIHINDLSNYLGMDFNWNIAPSNAHTNLELINLLIDDVKINPFIFDAKNIANCIEKIKEFSEGITRLTPITPHNITEVFKKFEETVIGKHNLDTNQLANLFAQLLINPEENYLHPASRRKTVVTRAFHEVSLKSRGAFESFFSHFSRDYSPKQKEHLTAVVDRLVQDLTRRKQGEFFTPTIWADKGHEYISDVIGEDWKEKYVVWDMCWGTGNLTRDYKFKKLYASTLNYSDTQTAEQMGYNPEGNIFQFDFLNHPIDYLPKDLQNSLVNGDKSLGLMNPPYSAGSNSNFDTDGGINGMSDTMIGEEMTRNKMGKAKQQLYAQFIYRCIELDLDVIALYSPALLLSGSSFIELRKKLEEKYEFVNGFLMDSNNFADVKSWGLSFTIWKKK